VSGDQRSADPAQPGGSSPTGCRTPTLAAAGGTTPAAPRADTTAAPRATAAPARTEGPTARPGGVSVESAGVPARPGAVPDARDAHLPLHRRVRSVLGGWVGAGRLPAAGGALPPLVSVHVQQRDDADVPTLERAYAVAEEQHRGQRRKSGEPFITHPLAVAMILANLGLDTTTLAAALLHDTI